MVFIQDDPQAVIESELFDQGDGNLKSFLHVMAPKTPQTIIPEIALGFYQLSHAINKDAPCCKHYRLQNGANVPLAQSAKITGGLDRVNPISRRPNRGVRRAGARSQPTFARRVRTGDPAT